METTNPFTHYIDVESRLYLVKNSFTLNECKAALKVPNLQKTVTKALEARIRRLEKAEDVLIDQVVNRWTIIEGGCNQVGRNGLINMLGSVMLHIDLDLEKLLAFDTFNFSHDIAGIINHVEFPSGKLKNHFIPRCAGRK